MLFRPSKGRKLHVELVGGEHEHGASVVNATGATFFEPSLDEMVKSRLLPFKGGKSQLILNSRGDVVGRGRQARPSQRRVDDFFDGQIRSNVRWYLFEEPDCGLASASLAGVRRLDGVFDCLDQRSNSPLDERNAARCLRSSFFC
jgi:hypothetical protein